jgi:hypothetical protein
MWASAGELARYDLPDKALGVVRDGLERAVALL